MICYASERQNTAVGSSDFIVSIRTTHRSNIPLAETIVSPLSIFMVGSFAKARAEDKATVKQDTVLPNFSLVLQGK